MRPCGVENLMCKNCNSIRNRELYEKPEGYVPKHYVRSKDRHPIETVSAAECYANATSWKARLRFKRAMKFLEA